METERTFKYRAFISYRHLSPDQEIAKRLHTMIETYRIPSDVRKSSGITSMGKVFRDKDELPLSASLSDDIHAALEESEWLICICSPRYLQSMWCLEELNYYISLGRKDHVLTILVEGEPSDSFPEQLLYDVIDGEKVPNEPLAADVRGDSLFSSMRKLANEKLRIFAPMLGVSYDDLRQRARQRRTRITAAAVTAALSLLSGFLIYAISKNRQISAQRNIAVDNQMKLLIEQSIQSSESGNKLLAVQQLLEAAQVREAVGDANDERLSAALEYALYDEPFQTILTIDSDNRNIGKLVFSHYDRYLAGITNINSAVLIDAMTGKILYTVSQSDTGTLDSVGFTLDDRYFYTVDSWYGYVCLYSTQTGELYRRFDDGSDIAMNIAEKVFTMSEQSLLIVFDKHLTVWDYEKDELKDILPCGDLPFEGYIRPLAIDLSPDRESLAVGSHGYGAGMKILSIDGKSETQLDFDPDRGYMNMMYSGDGRYVTAVSGSLYQVWNVSTGNLILKGDSGDPTGIDVLINYDGSILMVMSSEMLRAVDTRTGSILWEKTADSNVVTEAYISPDGMYVSALGGINGVFVLRTGEQKYENGATLFSNDGSMVITAAYTGDPHLLVTPPASTWTLEEDFSSELFEVPRFTAPSADIYVELKHQAGEYYTTPPGNANRQSGFYTDTELRYAAHTDYDGFIEIFDISDPGSAREIACMAEHCYNSVTDLVFSRDLMASCGGFDPRCVLFDLNRGQIRFALAGEEYCWGCEFSSDGTKIIMLCGYARDRAFVYSTLTGNLLYTFRSPDERTIDMIGFTEDGKRVAAVMNDGSAMTGTIYSGLDEMIEIAKSK